MLSLYLHDTTCQVHTWTCRARTNIEKYENLLGVDMKTKPVLVIADKMSGTRCKITSYENLARPFASFNTFQIQQHDHDPCVRPYRHTTVKMMHPPSDTVPTLSLCYCVYVSSNADLSLFRKISPEQKSNNTGAKYAVTISGGRQRHNANTRESLSSTNVLQQQEAVKSSNTLQYLYEYNNCCYCCMICTWYVNTSHHTCIYQYVWKYTECSNIIKVNKC